MLIFFEHLITIDYEIDLFWKRGFSGAATLFFMNRYIINVYSALALVVLLDTSVTNQVSQADRQCIYWRFNVRLMRLHPTRCELVSLRLLADRK